jgi:hypothetical protein
VAPHGRRHDTLAVGEQAHGASGRVVPVDLRVLVAALVRWNTKPGATADCGERATVTGSRKKVSCSRAPRGMATRCSCSTSPKRVAINNGRRVASRRSCTTSVHVFVEARGQRCVDGGDVVEDQVAAFFHRSV